MNVYQRTQYTRAVFTAPLYYGWVVALLVVFSRSGFEGLVPSLPYLAVPLLVGSVFFLGFRSLMVTVTAQEVRLAFSFGWPNKTIERSRITSARPLRIPWWYGLGIRYTPKGWMWNIWGLDTVRLSLSDGKGFLIGTDDPAGLAAAIVLQDTARAGSE